MSDSESSKLDGMTSRIKEVVGDAQPHLNTRGLMHLIQEAIDKVGRTVDTDAIAGRFKEAASQTDDKIDAGKLRQAVADADRDKLKSLLGDAQHLGASAVSHIGTQSEKLADRAPGAFDKLAGAARERLAALTGDAEPINEGQLERFKGQIKETIASVSELAENRSKDTVETIKSKLDEETRRN